MGQVCQKCSDGDLTNCAKTKNAPLSAKGKGGRGQRLPGSSSQPNSDMFFTEAERDGFEYGVPNTMYTQPDDVGSSFFNSQYGTSQTAGGQAGPARELQQYQSQQRALVSTFGSLPPFDEKTLFNPLRIHIDKLLQLKIRSHLKYGNPLIEELDSLQNEPLHQYRGKHIKEQKGKGINAQGDKKLITDYAFFEDIIVKLHFLNEIQTQYDQAIASAPDSHNSTQADQTYEQVQKVGQEKNRNQDTDTQARIETGKFGLDSEKQDVNFYNESGQDSTRVDKEAISIGEINTKEQKLVTIEN